MAESPDPLGKRALFWAPAERVEDGPRRSATSQIRGKHALDSSADSVPVATEAVAARGPRSGAAGDVTTHEGRRPRPGGGPAGSVLSAIRTGGFIGPVTLDCSACGSRTDVDVFEFLMLHLPVWFWRPGRGYARLMTCPACRRRAWISASISAWSR